MNNSYMTWISAGIIVMMLSSCISGMASKNKPSSNNVQVIESSADIKEKCNKINKDKTYLRKFSVRAKTNDKYKVIIYDKNYMSINGAIYAYNFKKLMYQSLVLNVGSPMVIDNTAKLIGIQGYCTPIDDTEKTYSFIIARDIFQQEDYNSMSQATRNNPGFSFRYLVDDYYIDDFGKHRKKTYWDYFDEIFKTTSKDVNTQMYIGFESDD